MHFMHPDSRRLHVILMWLCTFVSVGYVRLRQMGNDRYLGYDPSFVSWFTKGEFVLAGGSNKQCNIYSRDGVQLGVVGDLPSWVWSAEVRPDANCVVRIQFSSILAFITSVTLSITIAESQMQAVARGGDCVVELKEGT